MRVELPRKPTVYRYKDFHTGEIVTIKRRPSTLRHDIMPKDTVELQVKKSDSWEAGEEFTVKHINSKMPNVLQIKNDDTDETTFVMAHEVVRTSERGGRGGKYEKTAYLYWP